MGWSRKLFDLGRSAFVVDGQNMRLGISRDLGFSVVDRSENLRRAAELGKLMNRNGLVLHTGIGLAQRGGARESGAGCRHGQFPGRSPDGAGRSLCGQESKRSGW